MFKDFHWNIDEDYLDMESHKLPVLENIKGEEVVRRMS